MRLSPCSLIFTKHPADFYNAGDFIFKQGKLSVPSSFRSFPLLTRFSQQIFQPPFIIMKVLFVALFLVAGAFARSAVHQQEIQAEGPRCPIDDPLIRDQVPLNVTVDPIVKLDEGSVMNNLIIEGLTSLHYTIDLNALLLTVTFQVDIGTVTGNATFSTSGYVDARPFRQETIPSGNLTATAQVGKVSATGVQLKGRASLFINIIGNKVQVSNLNLEVVTFETVSLDFGNMQVGGSSHDWAAISRNLKANFDRDLAEHKAAITDKIRVAANGIVGKYTLQELIDIIGGGGDDEPCDP